MLQREQLMRGNELRRSPASFSVYVPRDHTTSHRNLSPGPWSRSFACERGLFFNHG